MNRRGPRGNSPDRGVSERCRTRRKMFRTTRRKSAEDYAKKCPMGRKEQNVRRKCAERLENAKMSKKIGKVLDEAEKSRIGQNSVGYYKKVSDEAETYRQRRKSVRKDGNV